MRNLFSFVQPFFLNNWSYHSIFTNSSLLIYLFSEKAIFKPTAQPVVFPTLASFFITHPHPLKHTHPVKVGGGGWKIVPISAVCRRRRKTVGRAAAAARNQARAQTSLNAHYFNLFRNFNPFSARVCVCQGVVTWRGKISLDSLGVCASQVATVGAREFHRQIWARLMASSIVFFLVGTSWLSLGLSLVSV